MAFPSRKRRRVLTFSVRMKPFRYPSLYNSFWRKCRSGRKEGERCFIKKLVDRRVRHPHKMATLWESDKRVLSKLLDQVMARKVDEKKDVSFPLSHLEEVARFVKQRSAKRIQGAVLDFLYRPNGVFVKRAILALTCVLD